MSLLFKVFSVMEIEEAVTFSKKGHIAIHLHHIVFDSSPRCFKRDVNQGYPIAHVFCQDRDTLVSLGRKLGVKVIYIDRDGQEGQHLDLCGVPLRKLLTRIGKDIEDYRRES